MAVVPVLAALVLALTAACGGEDASVAPETGAARAERSAVAADARPETATRPVASAAPAIPPAAPSAGAPSAPAPTCSPGEPEPLGDERRAFAFALTRPAEARWSPDGAVRAVFETENVNGYPTVFGAVGVVYDGDCEPAWYRVQLPIRPNGAKGYVRADAGELFSLRERIEVDLSERRVAVLRDGRPFLELTTAVGAPGTPTPTGRYYVNQKLSVDDPRGPFGPGALGISAFSPTLVHWPQGGPIAIHGTNDPSSIGRNVSTGCLRVPNEIVELLLEEIPAGTPVVIRA